MSDDLEQDRRSMLSEIISVWQNRRVIQQNPTLEQILAQLSTTLTTLVAQNNENRKFLQDILLERSISYARVNGHEGRGGYSEYVGYPRAKLVDDGDDYMEDGLGVMHSDKKVS